MHRLALVPSLDYLPPVPCTWGDRSEEQKIPNTVGPDRDTCAPAFTYSTLEHSAVYKCQTKRF